MRLKKIRQNIKGIFSGYKNYLKKSVLCRTKEGNNTVALSSWDAGARVASIIQIVTHETSPFEGREHEFT